MGALCTGLFDDVCPTVSVSSFVVREQRPVFMLQNDVVFRTASAEIVALVSWNLLFQNSCSLEVESEVEQGPSWTIEVISSLDQTWQLWSTSLLHSSSSR